MVSVRRYHRFLLTLIAVSAAAAVTGIILLTLGISMPGTIALIAGIMVGSVAGMEWRCREKPARTVFVHPPTIPAIEVVVIPAQGEITNIK
jgi:hypothetical protein